LMFLIYTILAKNNLSNSSDYKLYFKISFLVMVYKKLEFWLYANKIHKLL